MKKLNKTTGESVTISVNSVWTVGPKTQEKLSEGASNEVIIVEVNEKEMKLVVLDSKKNQKEISPIGLGKFIKVLVNEGLAEIKKVVKATTKVAMTIKKGDKVELQSGVVGTITKYMSNKEITLTIDPTNPNSETLICDKESILRVVEA